jgi:hypothetical protein
MEARQKAIDKLNETAPELLGNLNLQNIATEEGTKMLDDYADALMRTAEAQAMQDQLVELFKKKIEIESQAAEESLSTVDAIAEGLTTGVAAVIDYSLGGLTDLTGAVDDAADSLAKQRQAEDLLDIDAKIAAMKELVKETKGNSLAVEATADAYKKEVKSAKKSAEETKQARQKSLQEQEADVNAFYQAVEEVETAHLDSLLTEQQKEINAVTDKFFELITLAEQYGEDTKLLEDARQKALEDIRKKYADQEAQRAEQQRMSAIVEEEELAEIIRQANQTKLQNERDDINAHYFDLIERAKQYGLDTTALEKERTDKLAELQIASEQKVFDAKMQLAQASIGILQGLQGLVKQGSDAQKALALTEIAANTAIGFVQGLNVAQKAAAGKGPAAGIAFPIFYASQIAAVLAAAGKAKSILGKGGGGGSAPSIPSAGATAGAGGVPLNNISNTASLVDQQQQEITTQVVVLESDITTTQENVTAVSELSSF